MATSSVLSEEVARAPRLKGSPRSKWLQFAAAVRWLHIYLSMVGFATILFFSVTGLTLNHPTWFGIQTDLIQDLSGQLEVAWVQGSTSSHSQAAVNASSEDVDKLSVVEYLRRVHQLHGAMSVFRVDDLECLVSFRGPGYSADAIIDRETGAYDLSISRNGPVAIINDLHKGRDSGAVWSVLIDVSAIVIAMSALTGFVLLLFIKRRRANGVLLAGVGTLAMVIAYACLVP